MSNVDRGGVIVLFVLQILYTVFFFVTRLIINKINQVQWVDFKLENVLVSLHSLKTMGLGSIIFKEWRVTGHSPILTQQVSLVEQELLTLPEHPSSPPALSGVHVVQSLVFCVVFCRSLFVILFFFFCPLCCLFFCSFSFVHCVVCSSSICEF